MRLRNSTPKSRQFKPRPNPHLPRQIPTDGRPTERLYEVEKLIKAVMLRDRVTFSLHNTEMGCRRFT